MNTTDIPRGSATIPNTHLKIDSRLCGRVQKLAPGECAVELVLTEHMRADVHGLAHGGFIFGAADYAAMVAVNDPNVVLGSADVKFTKPCCIGETLRFAAHVDSIENRRRVVNVEGSKEDGTVVFVGTFICFVLDQHVLTQAG